MATATALMTAEEFAQLPDTRLIELVRGVPVEMPRPTVPHGAICRNVLFELEQWARRTSAGLVLPNDTGVLTERDPDTVRGPDCMFIRRDRLPKSLAGLKWLEFPPDLAVEVMSPTDRWRDVVAKAGEYLRFGVTEVWVLDERRRQLHQFRADAPPETLLEDAEVTGDPLLPDFRCAVAEFFRDV